MKELRCLVFTNRELAEAIIDRRRRTATPMPGGAPTRCQVMASEPLSAKLVFAEGEELEIDEQEMQAALVARCMSKGVPLPVNADKTLHVVKGNITLMVAMGYNKAARMIVSQQLA